MNELLDRLHRYPFEKLNRLLEGAAAPAHLDNIPLSLGEPRHPAPDFVVAMLSDPELLRRALGTYPATRGLPELRQAIARWLERRYGIANGVIDAESQVLPVNGTREALFAVAQAITNPSAKSSIVLPNPFYQIYEGAAILAGATPVFVNCTAETDFIPAFDAIDEATWARCSMLYLNSPGNPCGKVLDKATIIRLIELADEYDFVIASDECYSEIYFDESDAPVGLLEACDAMGRDDFRRCLVFNSLSKRSNLPGLRSGLAAGDAELIGKFLLYRTYHGSAMPVQNQVISAAAWNDESHVWTNRQVYREKFAAVLAILGKRLAVSQPEGGFYLWPIVPGSDTDFARSLYEQENVTVLPGSFLSRESGGINPGNGRVRMALVAPVELCTEAAERIARFLGG